MTADLSLLELVLNASILVQLVMLLLLAASLVFMAIHAAFDTVCHAPVRTGTWAGLRRRLLAFAVVVLTGAALVASFADQPVSSLIRDVSPATRP